MNVERGAHHVNFLLPCYCSLVLPVVHGLQTVALRILFRYTVGGLFSNQLLCHSKSLLLVIFFLPEPVKSNFQPS